MQTSFETIPAFGWCLAGTDNRDHPVPKPKKVVKKAAKKAPAKKK